ncbi:hypothetical protein KY290_021764 [Solanum tuberosum]|uniref:MULE transposase domain-containing protein n=1 Tax=Solanum tuberosum TaxID=4113 RepID=A0ABQ7V4H4_SOLTU|nr:hypothetical protein KY290_021764 [Solanum tuberosum]
MGDHVEEFKRILDYRDELLKTNPGSTCVVRLSEETFEGGRKMFQSFYICFDALKKAFKAGARRCIGFDGCFLKGVSRGQLLVAVCKDGNNQMLPLAWAVVELVRHDLELGDGTELTTITDMQKDHDKAIQDLLPNAEQRMCARHVLANWSKNWKGIEKRNCFWRCAKSTYEQELKRNLDHMEKLGTGICDDLLWYNIESKETYLKVYSHYIQPVTNMKMWPLSANPSVIPPVIKTLPGRPRKCRRKEQNENKTGKLSKRGVEMTCSLCHAKGHNKRGCHLNNQANAGRGRGMERGCEPSSTRSSVGSSRAPTESQSSTKRGRGRPRGSTKQASATGRGRGTATGNGTGIGVAADSSSATGRGRGTGTGLAGRGRRTSVAATATDVPGATGGGKRPIMVGMGILHTQSGFTIHNPGMPMNSSIVTGNLGHHKPRSGLK